MYVNSTYLEEISGVNVGFFRVWSWYLKLWAFLAHSENCLHITNMIPT